MPEPLKNLYNRKFITSLTDVLDGTCDEFKTDKFIKSIFNKDWKNKELKQRIRHITETLHAFMPQNYRKALNILKPAATNFGGLEPMFFPDYIEVYGLDDYETSVSALEWMTQFSSSEFAVRPFIVKYPKKMMQQMALWAKHENHHVRRLASEGCRPRLPWAMALPEFKKDPEPVLRVIKKLKADESEYVRRSVANNLNDISKDHPKIVTDIAKQWMGKTKETDQLVKHACRTLLKSSDYKTLQLFGYKKPTQIQMKNLKISSRIKMGGELDFSFVLVSKQKRSMPNNLGKLRIEYAIDFVRTNNRMGRKMFKISEGVFTGDEKHISKKHSFRPISTRRYYPGTHGLTLFINGYEFGSKKFTLR